MSVVHMPAKFVDRNGKGNFCLRICNEEGEHCLSLLPCGIDRNGDVICWDLADPDGNVVWCGIENDLVDVFVKSMGGWNKIKP